MTLWEIQKAIEGKQSRIKFEVETEMRIQAMIAYRQADLISSMVGKLFGGKHKIPSLAEAFPGVFPDEVVRPKQQDWRVMKARLEAYAAAKRKWEVSKRGNNDRGTSSTDHSENKRTAKGDGPRQRADAVNQKGNGSGDASDIKPIQTNR